MSIQIKPQFFRCDDCMCYHSAEFYRDCRQDAQCFHADELDCQYGQDGWTDVDEEDL